MQLEFTPEGVLSAYMYAVFPMAHEEIGEIWWYRPDPPAIVPLDAFHVSRSLSRTIRRGKFAVTFDRAFEDVMRGCADRPEGTWISEEFVRVYTEMHRLGYGHSVEVWHGDSLVGGTYGVAIGAAFMAESMFHRETDASKVALAALVDRLREREYELLDVQYITPHLASLGAVEIPHNVYIRRLHRAIRATCRFTD